MQADGALNQKLEAWVQINKVWAGAMAQNQMVPDVVIGADGKSSPTSTDFMQLMTAMSAKQLSVDVATK